ncbi:hypothetical protein T06_17044, partial [Trichinella sp. T6]
MAFLYLRSMLRRARLLRAEHSASSTRAHSHAPRSPLSVSGLSPPVHHVVLPKDSVRPGASDAGAGSRTMILTSRPS